MGQAGAATRGLAYQQMMLYMAQQRYARQAMMVGAATLGAGVLAIKAAADFEQYRVMIFAVTRDQGAANRVFEDAIDIGMRMPGSTKEVIRAGVELTNYAEITGLATLSQKKFMQGTVDLASVFRGAEMEIDPHRMATAIISFLGGRVEMLRRLGMSLSVLQQFGYKTDMGPAERLNVLLRVMERYAGAAGLQMKTLTGAMSNFWDVTVRVSASLMEPMLPAFTAAVRVAEAFGRAVNWLPGPIKGLIGATGLLAATTTITTGAIIALRAAYHVARIEMQMWTAATGAATAAQTGLAGATAAAGAAAGGAAAGGVAAGTRTGMWAGIGQVTGLSWLGARAKGAGRWAATKGTEPITWLSRPGVPSGQAMWAAQEAQIAAMVGISRAQQTGAGLATAKEAQVAAQAAGVAAQVAGRRTVGVLSSIWGFVGPWGLLTVGVTGVAIGLLKWHENIEKARRKMEETAQAAFKLGRTAKTAFRDIMQGEIAPQEYFAQKEKLAKQETAAAAAWGAEKTFRGLPLDYQKEAAFKWARRPEKEGGMGMSYVEAQWEMIKGGKELTATYARSLHFRTMVAEQNVKDEQARTEEMRQKYAKGQEEAPSGAAGGWADWARKIIGGGEEYAKAVHPLDVLKGTGVLPWKVPKKAVIELIMPPGWAAKIKEDTVGITVRQVTQAVGAM